MTICESSRRDLFIDMVIWKFIFENNVIKLLSRFTFIPKTGIILYCEELCLVKSALFRTTFVEQRQMKELDAKLLLPILKTDQITSSDESSQSSSHC